MRVQALQGGYRLAEGRPEIDYSNQQPSLEVGNMSLVMSIEKTLRDHLCFY